MIRSCPGDRDESFAVDVRSRPTVGSPQSHPRSRAERAHAPARPSQRRSDSDSLPKSPFVVVLFHVKHRGSPPSLPKARCAAVRCRATEREPHPPSALGARICLLAPVPRAANQPAGEACALLVLRLALAPHLCTHLISQEQKVLSEPRVDVWSRRRPTRRTSRRACGTVGGLGRSDRFRPRRARRCRRAAREAQGPVEFGRWTAGSPAPLGGAGRGVRFEWAAPF